MSNTSKSQPVSSSLSVDAPVFTPGSYNVTSVPPAALTTGEHVGGVPLSEVPGYMTSCFPFVQPGEESRSSKYGQPGSGRGRGGGRPFTGRGGKILRGGLNQVYSGNQWQAGYQLNPSYVPQIQKVPGMTFDGGTSLGDGLLPTPVCTPGYVHTSLNGFGGGMFGFSSIHQQVSPNSWDNFQRAMVPTRVVTNQSLSMKANQVDMMTSPDASRISGNVWSGNPHQYGSNNCVNEGKTRSRPHTIICKDMSVQTDFSDELAAQTLSQKPNSLFSCSHTRRRKDKSRSSTSVVSYTSDSEVDSDSGYSSPLHRRNVRSNGTDPVGPLLLPAQTPDTERGRNILGRNMNSVSPVNKFVLPNPQQVTYASVAQHAPTPPPRRTLNYADVVSSQSTVCDNSALSSSVINPADGVNEDSQNTDVGKKKRRRRNRRRKKKGNDEDDGQSDRLSSTGRTFSSSNVSRTSDVTLHFEDDEEFPDLYHSNVESGHEREGDLFTRPGSMQIKSSPSSHISRSSSRQSDDFDLSREHTGDENCQDPKQETKSARKRRKRRELANKAAEVELAEISLEQQMLKELSLKPKQGQETKTTTTPSSTGGSKSPLAGKPGGIISDTAVVAEAKKSKEGGGSGKKSKQPIAIDLSAFLSTALEKKREDAESKDQKLNKKKVEKVLSKSPANVLDASAPLKRGKERENPKPKKPSPLKKVILKEREQKKKLRLLDDDHDTTGLHITEAPVGIGVVNAESDLSQDGLSSKSSMELGNGASTSADLSPISQTSPISMSPLSPGTSPLSSGVNSPITGHMKESLAAMMKIHSRRFREYCNQVLDKDIDSCCVEFLQDLVRFQDRMFHKDPVKAKARRRIVLGLREVTKHLKLKKIKCVIISPNLEKIQSKGGLDDALNNILNMCQEQNIPFVFALGRRALGRACAKLVPVSCAGVFNYDGCEDTFKKLMDYTEKAREAYKEMVLCLEKEMEDYPPRSTTSIYAAHLGHSRTPSGCSVMSFTSSILSEPISENYPHSEPETDSKGYEIVKEATPVSYLGSSTTPADTKMNHGGFPAAVHEIDDGNEADTEDCADNLDKSVTVSVEADVTSEEKLDSGKATVVESDDENTESDDDEEEEEESDEDTESSDQASDKVEELPHIDSIHSANYDLSTEILSQHSGRTLDRSEVMSTHSSRTLGEGSSTIMTDMTGVERTKADVTKAFESPGEGMAQHRLKLSDKDRIQSWVDASNSNLSDNSDGDVIYSGSVTESETESDSHKQKLPQIDEAD